jgi:hypothetical protein
MMPMRFFIKRCMTGMEIWYIDTDMRGLAG